MVNDSLQPSASSRTRRQRLLVASILCLLFGTAFLGWFSPWTIRVTDNERVPGETEELKDDAIRVKDPDNFGTKGSLNLPDGGLLEFRYGPINDSGVELRRLDRGGNVLWEQGCVPLGVRHSKYRHDVFVQIEGLTVKVVSRGSYGTFVERLDLDSGNRLARSERR